MTPWTVAHKTPLSMGFPRQEHWSGLPFPSLGDFSDPGIEPWSLAFHPCCVFPVVAVNSQPNSLNYLRVSGGLWSEGRDISVNVKKIIKPLCSIFVCYLYTLKCFDCLQSSLILGGEDSDEKMIKF